MNSSIQASLYSDSIGKPNIDEFDINQMDEQVFGMAHMICGPNVQNPGNMFKIA